MSENVKAALFIASFCAACIAGGVAIMVWG